MSIGGGVIVVALALGIGLPRLISSTASKTVEQFVQGTWQCHWETMYEDSVQDNGDFTLSVSKDKWEVSQASGANPIRLEQDKLDADVDDVVPVSGSWRYQGGNLLVDVPTDDDYIARLMPIMGVGLPAGELMDTGTIAFKWGAMLGTEQGDRYAHTVSLYYSGPTVSIRARAEAGEAYDQEYPANVDCTRSE
ncbi:MAG: hypothetical protein FWD29_10015 [Micrococcales bacterium]|nr:hypothetical protein [Micrococcales bacterium]